MPKKSRKTWQLTPPRKKSVKVPDTVKQQIQEKCDRFIEGTLKPQHLEKKPPDSILGSCEEIYGKWYRSFFHFYAVMRFRPSDDPSPPVENRFARLEYMGDNQFNLGNESPLLKQALPQLTDIAQEVGLELKGSVISLDGVYDSRSNRKAIFNRGMIPNIPENQRGRKQPKGGRKRIFKKRIFQERFSTIERIFAWEDKFRRLLLRFERISRLHYALKTLAYTMINLRHFCCR